MLSGSLICKSRGSNLPPLTRIVRVCRISTPSENSNVPHADLGQTDEGGVSAGPERDNLVPELDPSGHRIELEEEDTDDRDVVQRWKLLKKHDISMPTIFLPAEMQKAVDSVLSFHSAKGCAQDGEEFSEYLHKRIPAGCEWGEQRYTRGEQREKLNSKPNPWITKPSRAIIPGDTQQEKSSKWSPSLKYRKKESVAFLAGRAQASYGTALRVLSEIGKRNESYSPQTMLDFGSGLGTVEWAAQQLWKDSIYEYQCVDISSEMLDMAKSLRLGGSNTAEMLECEKAVIAECIPGVYSRQYLPLSRKVQYDIVVSGHSLGELPSANLRSFTVGALWRKAKDYLVLIEPGTWSGYRVIMEARNMILNASAWTKFEDETTEDLEGHVFAPCPHDSQCPLLSDQDNLPKNPCHFAQRVQLSHSEKSTFLKKLGCHIESFSYIIFKKGGRESNEDHQVRLIEPVKKRSRHILCKMCTSKGEVKRDIYTKKKHADLYKEGRRSNWGDILDLTEQDSSIRR